MPPATESLGGILGKSGAGWRGSPQCMYRVDGEQGPGATVFKKRFLRTEDMVDSQNAAFASAKDMVGCAP